TMFGERGGLVDLVVWNPAYVAWGAQVAPEVAEDEPEYAVYAGEGGLAVIRDVVAAAARLLTTGGVVAVEHDDTHASAVPGLLSARRVLGEVVEHKDLAGRPRFVTAQRVDTLNV